MAKGTSKPGNDETARKYWAMVEMVALSTVGWAKEHGCYMDDKGDIGNYFVISERADADKPHWPDHAKRVISVTEKFGFSRFWGDVLVRMIALGIPVCRKEGAGFYIGKAGMQGKIIGFNAKHVIKRAESLNQQLEAVRYSDQSEKVALFLESALPKGIEGIDMEKIRLALTDLLLALGQPIQLHLPEKNTGS